MTESLRIVLDTNVLLRGLLNMNSAAGRVVDACDRRSVLLLLSKPVLAEYRRILTDDPIVERYPKLTADNVEVALRRLRYVGDMIRSTPRFEFQRDPKDAKFLELAIAGRATHLVSGDKDLLSLKSGHTDSARQFRRRAPGTAVLDAADFLQIIG